jgi:COP9 signalosome complex subunit 5
MQGAGDASIPLAKAADFGAHANHYYSLEVSHFKSTLDAKMLEALWNKYWVQTLSASPLFTNREYGTKQIQDLAGKITQEDKQLKSSRGGIYAQGDKKVNLAKIVGPSKKIQREEEMGLLAAAVKGKVFRMTDEPKDEEMKT